MEIKRFLNKDGKVKAWPSKHEGKLAVLRHLGNKLETGRFYTEKEINAFLDANHAFGDYFLLRRELVDHGVLVRTANGARYWRGGLWAEFRGKETERLLIQEALASDSEEIGGIYRSCGYIAKWTGMEHDEASLVSLLENSDLPPDGSSEFSHLVVLREKANGSAVGLCQYYTAWPDAGSMWVGLMIINPEHQKKGYGSEFVAVFREECARQDYHQIGLGAALRNTPAVKFWVKSGFDRIVRVTADGESSESSKSMLSLRMVL